MLPLRLFFLAFCGVGGLSGLRGQGTCCANDRLCRVKCDKNVCLIVAISSPRGNIRLWGKTMCRPLKL